MTTMKTIQVLFKGDDWKFIRKYLVYEDVKLDEEDPVVKNLIKDARDCLTVKPEVEEVKFNMVSK